MHYSPAHPAPGRRRWGAPCVCLVPLPSLRAGPGRQLLQLWGGDPRSALVACTASPLPPAAAEALAAGLRALLPAGGGPVVPGQAEGPAGMAAAGLGRPPCMRVVVDGAVGPWLAAPHLAALAAAARPKRLVLCAADAGALASLPPELRWGPSQATEASTPLPGHRRAYARHGQLGPPPAPSPPLTPRLPPAPSQCGPRNPPARPHARTRACPGLRHTHRPPVSPRPLRRLARPRPGPSLPIPYWAFNLIDLNFDNGGRRLPPAIFWDLVVRIC
jgi:hypothetical protein